MTHRLPDLCHHQAWADAEHWRALSNHPAALDDLQIPCHSAEPRRSVPSA